MSEDAVFQRSKGMLHRRASQSHHLRSCALLHALQDVFVQVSGDETLCAVGTTRLQGTSAAGFCGRGIVHGAITARKLLARKRLLARTAESVALLLVVEFAAIKQGAVAMVVHRTVGRHVWHDALPFTGLRLFPV